MGSQRTVCKRDKNNLVPQLGWDKNNKKKCEKGMTAKFFDTVKHLHTEFLKRRALHKKRWFVSTGQEF